MRRTTMLGIIALICLVSITQAAPPALLTHQGRLLDASDTPIDGTVSLTFRLYSVPTGGVEIAAETQMVTVDDGLFSVQLSALSSSTLYSTDEERWLGVTIDGTELLPRLRIGATPYAVVAKSINGDLTTSPGTLSLQSSTVDVSMSARASGGGSYKLFSVTGQPTPVGEASSKVSSGHESDGLDDTWVTNAAGSTDARSIVAADLDADGLEDIAVASTITPTKAQLAIKTKGTSAQRDIVETCDDGNEVVSIEMTVDDDNDGLDDGSIVSKLTPTVCSHAINTKGTGAQGGRVVVSHDSQGGVVGERDIIMVSDATSSRMAIKTKGTGAQFADIDDDCDGITARHAINTKGTGTSGRSSMHHDDDNDGLSDASDEVICSAAGVERAINTKGTGATVRTTMSQDDDEDGDPESDIDFVIKPDTARVAIKTRGTGADKNVFRQTQDTDEDGNPESEFESVMTPDTARVAIKTRGTGADNNVFRQTQDNDDDGVPDNSIESIVTPIKSEVAINTKGTGADKGRIIMSQDSDGDGLGDNEIDCRITPSTSSLAIKTKGTSACRMSLDSDSDGDGTPENSVSSDCDDNAASISIDEPGVHIQIQCKDAYGNLVMRTVGGGGLPDTTVALTSDGRLGLGVPNPTNPIDHASGAHLTAGGTWTNASDKNLKENFSEVNGEEILDKIESLPITEWNYKTEDDDVKHIGPTAQDFNAAFGVGNDKTISTIDPSGVALAAIKELSKKTKEIDELKKEIAELRKMVVELSKK